MQAGTRKALGGWRKASKNDRGPGFGLNERPPVPRVAFASRRNGSGAYRAARQSARLDGFDRMCA